MTFPFPDSMDFTGFNAPSRVECDIHDLVIEGTLPAGINGTWYRLTPDPPYPPLLGDDTFLGGDGMASLFRFRDGHVDYKSRYVLTERLLDDRKARRSLHGQVPQSLGGDRAGSRGPRGPREGSRVPHQDAAAAARAGARQLGCRLNG